MKADIKKKHQPVSFKKSMLADKTKATKMPVSSIGNKINLGNKLSNKIKPKIIKGELYYDVFFKNSNVEFQILSNDKCFVDENITLFMLQDSDNPALEDAMERISAIIDDISSTKTE